MKRKNRESSKDTPTCRHEVDPKSIRERRMTEAVGLQVDRSIKTYAPDVWEQVKAVMRFKWQRGHGDAMSGRPIPERAVPVYFDGYEAGKAKFPILNSLAPAPCPIACCPIEALG